jgi:hypothetical protein
VRGGGENKESRETGDVFEQDVAGRNIQMKKQSWCFNLQGKDRTASRSHRFLEESRLLEELNFAPCVFRVKCWKVVGRLQKVCMMNLKGLFHHFDESQILAIVLVTSSR